MKIITIKTQKDLDNLPLTFKEFTEIEIRSSEVIEIRKACDNSTVTAYGNSTVRACDNSTVRACDNSTVTAYGNSTVTAYGNSTVTAYGNSTVTAYGNSTVTAYGNSTVRACDNSTVTATEMSIITVESTSVKLEASLNSVIILRQNIKFKKVKTVTVVRQKQVEHNLKTFKEVYPENVVDGEIILYKSVSPTNLTDFKTGKIKYEIGKTIDCPDFDPDKNRECGGGLHLSPTPELALNYNQGKLLKCRVKVKDMVIYSKCITKVRCRKVFVEGEV